MNLKKLIKTQASDLIKAKEERLDLIIAISKEKRLISKKTTKKPVTMKLRKVKKQLS